MKKEIFKGCATALVTPMLPNGSINFNRLADLVDEQINAGIDALVVTATTGESATLGCDEHIEAIKVAVLAAKKRVPVIASTGSNDTNHSIMMSKRALDVGADALLSVTPYYNKTSQDGLFLHFEKIASSVDLPIIVYNVPSRTGLNIKPETYLKLSKIPNIVATKEANGDISSIIKTISLCGDDLAVYSGNDDQIVPIMALGGKGVISVFSNVCPSQGHKLTRLCLDGDFKKATEYALKYLDLMNALFIDVNPIPVKAAMNMLDKNCGDCRLPLAPLNEKNSAILKDELKKLNLL